MVQTMPRMPIFMSRWSSLQMMAASVAVAAALAQRAPHMPPFHRLPYPPTLPMPTAIYPNVIRYHYLTSALGHSLSPTTHPLPDIPAA